MKKFKIFLITGVAIFFQHFGNAQTNENNHFLQKIGVLDSLYSQTLKESRDIYVQLPTNYNPNSDKKYPVAFILDGEIFLPTVSNVQDYYSGGFTPEMILVAISNSKNRMRDLTTSNIKEMYGMPFNEENGAAINFIKFIETELIPFIEKKYPVTHFRTLIGHSYGGLFTIYTLIHHPHLFSNYLAIDPSLDWDSQKLINESREILSSHNYKGKSLFMSLSGQLHMQNPLITIENVMQDTSTFTLFARSNITFSDIIKENKKNELAFKWKFYPRDLHGTIPFPSIMDGLIFDFEWYQWEETDKFNSPDTPKEDLFKIVKYRESKLKNYFGYSVPPYPEEILNMSGYMNLDMQQSEKAKMFFELAIEYYPKSANAYDSMADYYERNKEYKKALKLATKAYEINATDYYKQRIETLKKK
ncbi:esterase [Flavobacterium jejuense]|uniref:Esterase n=1 Tax=Flavobacterium jejuense TaxID=1544455 RepID=A0ABX0IQE2_9FLAO|nr:alpha/beta hydrolase-fold protein [Flavobacterium jejuense]NHN24060.1 esterase [Flavobacterium jejuense]